MMGRPTRCRVVVLISYPTAAVSKPAAENSDGADLPIHIHKVEVVPGFNDLSVFDPHEAHARKLHRRVTGGNAQMIAGVLTTNRTTGRNHVSFSDYVFHLNFDVGKCSAKDLMKWLEAGRTC